MLLAPTYFMQMELGHRNMLVDYGIDKRLVVSSNSPSPV